MLDKIEGTQVVLTKFNEYYCIEILNKNEKDKDLFMSLRPPYYIKNKRNAILECERLQKEWGDVPIIDETDE